MEINERGDIVISQEDNAISLINELLLTLPDGYIDTIEILLNELSIENQEKFVIEIEKKQLHDLASRASGIYWKSHYEISKKKYFSLHCGWSLIFTDCTRSVSRCKQRVHIRHRSKVRPNRCYRL